MVLRDNGFIQGTEIVADEILKYLQPKESDAYLKLAKSVNTSNSELLLVEVPEDACNFKLKKDAFGLFVFFNRTKFKYQGLTSHCSKTLPKGKYELIGLLKDITEEMARELGYSSLNEMKLRLQIEGINCICNPYGGERPVVDHPDQASQYYASQLYKQQLWDEAQGTGNIVVLKKI